MTRGFPMATTMRDEAWPVRERIVAFARDASFELSPRDGAALAAAAALAPGSRISITWLPRDADDDRVAAARALHDRGLVPVPHIAARMIEDEAHLAGLIGRLCGEAGVSQLLVIGGDAKQPRGPFAASTDLLSSPALAHPMVRRIAVGGYPEGHPWAGEALLDAKIAAIGALGVTAEVITQLCFDSGPILAWARVFRARHPEVPVRLGIAGPASIRTLLRYARICGVGNSAKALVARGASIARLLAEAAPDPLLRDLAETPDIDALAPVGVHLFPFGGFERTARWIGAVAEGHFRFRGSDSGFQVDPAG
ncbi:methylenetetrahydrofolate reductase [Sphingomonas sp. C8-2]|nr:methylenetetrahydrofolate reductase [Sphingomonas sp. C8-2]